MAPSPERRRLRNLFTATVFAVVGVGLAVAWLRPEEPLPSYETPPALGLPELALPFGAQEVSGVVVDPGGAPVVGALVEVRDGGRPQWDTTDAGGAFQLGRLSAGEHVAVLLAEGHPPTRVRFSLPGSADVRWTLAGPLSALEPLPPVPRTDLAGSLVPSVGSPVAGCEVLLVPSPATDPSATDVLSGAVLRRARADGTGAFAFPGAAHGAYRLRVLPPWAAGGSWPLLAEVPLDHGAGARPLKVPLAGGGLRTRLLDGEGRAVEGALVLVSPEGQPGRVWPAAESDRTGWARVGDLPAGRYRVELFTGALAEERSLEIQGAQTVTIDFGPLLLR